jgi:hypothetical protein
MEESGGGTQSERKLAPCRASGFQNRLVDVGVRGCALLLATMLYSQN